MPADPGRARGPRRSLEPRARRGDRAARGCGVAKAEDLLELAALHGARARAAPRAQDRGAGFSSAIAFYRRYLFDSAALADRVDVVAALARDLDDTGDAAGAIAARRALVCPGLPADPSDGYPLAAAPS